MTASKKVILPLLKEFPKYIIVEEIKKETEEKVKKIPVKEKEVDLIQRRRDDRKWENSMSYFLLNQEKHVFRFKDLK